MNKESTITLTIKKPSTNEFIYHIDLDGESIVNNQTLSASDAKSIAAFSRDFNQSFEHGKLPMVANDSLKAIGTGIFNLFLGGAWAKLSGRITNSHRTLVIASDLPEILNLPWELLYIPDADFIGFDPKWSVRRLPWSDKHLASAPTALRPGPLRVLIIACSPTDQHELDYEREEECLLAAIAAAGPNAVFETCDMGTFDELQQKINEFDPHIVHMTGHGTIKDGMGFFCFEDESGKADLRSSKEIGQRLFSGSNVQCVFVSGCLSGKAPQMNALSGVCQGLVREEMPLAVGWTASILDTVAIDFANKFYKTLVTGVSIDKALTQARQHIRKQCESTGTPNWTLPVLYASTKQELLMDLKADADPPCYENTQQQPIPGMKSGYTEHFVGRRRDIQKLLPRLRDGSLQVVIMTGMGGTGKSTLATRLVWRLKTDGFIPIAVSAAEDNPHSASRILESCRLEFLKKGMREEHSLLNDPGILIADKLQLVVGYLNDGHFILVLDNFEVNMDESTRKILDPELSTFYQSLVDNLSGNSRVIITSRYLPSDTSLQSGVEEYPLGDFTEPQFIKFILRDEDVEKRYYSGQLSSALLKRLYELFGGTPRFMTQIRTVLKTISSCDLQAELDKVEISTEVKKSQLQEIRDKYCESIFTARLFGYLSPESQKALCCAAVYGITMNPEGIAAASGESVSNVLEYTRQWQDYALAYPELEKADGTLWSIYRLLKTWLLSPERISIEDRKAACKRAGTYLWGIDSVECGIILGIPEIGCLVEARSMYIAAQQYGDAINVTTAISNHLNLSGAYAELIRLSQQICSIAAHPRPLFEIGKAYMEMGEYGIAKTNLTRSLEMYQKMGDNKGILASYYALASVCLKTDGNKLAKEMFDRILQISQQIGDKAAEAATLHQLATIDLDLGDFNAAKDKCDRSLQISLQIGDTTGEAEIWHQLATIDLVTGDYDMAKVKFDKSLKIKKQEGNKAGEAVTWHNLATIDFRTGDFKAAKEKFSKALKMSQQIGDKATEAITVGQIGGLAYETRRPEIGIKLLALCYMIHYSIGYGMAKNDWVTVTKVATVLGYSQEELNTVFEEAEAAYANDQGWGLVREAFGEEP